MTRPFFSEQPDIRNIVNRCEPLEISELIVTDKIIDNIVTYSNLSATQFLGNKEFKKSSRLHKWTYITAPEARLYLAPLIYREMLCKPKEHLYYGKNKLFEAP